jgi:hypothetical protein
LPLQPSEEVQGRKKILSAKGTMFPGVRGSYSAFHSVWFITAGDSGNGRDRRAFNIS